MGIIELLGALLSASFTLTEERKSVLRGIFIACLLIFFSLLLKM
jgi:hypothetical protein